MVDLNSNLEDSFFTLTLVAYLVCLKCQAGMAQDGCSVCEREY